MEKLWETEVSTAVVQREVAVAWSGQCYWRGRQWMESGCGILHLFEL